MFSFTSAIKEIRLLTFSSFQKTQQDLPKKNMLKMKMLNIFCRKIKHCQISRQTFCPEKLKKLLTLIIRNATSLKKFKLI